MRHLRLGGLSLRLPASPSLRALSSSPLQQDPLHSQDSGSDSAPRLGSVTPEEAQSYRKEHDVRIKGFSGDMDSLAPFTSFDTLPFSPALVQSLRKQGFSAPTAIQAQSWPIALLKRDMISIARTGSGKTCAFLLPALQALSQTPVAPPSSGDERDRARRRKPRRVPRTLVLAPTRELAQQIEREAAKYTSSVGVTVASFYGGTPKGPQMRQLSRGVDVVVATPGRCNDLVETGMLDLSSVDYLVLDEADRMLDMG
jgi:ATP-dependent RNA helicase DDX5/DBP2